LIGNVESVVTVIVTVGVRGRVGNGGVVTGGKSARPAEP
jgi:hypothetical protein